MDLMFEDPFGFVCVYVDASVRLVSCGMTFVFASTSSFESSVRIVSFLWTFVLLSV